MQRLSFLWLEKILFLLYGVVQTEGALGVEGAGQGEVDVRVGGLRDCGGQNAGEGGGRCVDNFPRETQTAVRPAVPLPVILH